MELSTPPLIASTTRLMCSCSCVNTSPVREWFHVEIRFSRLYRFAMDGETDGLAGPLQNRASLHLENVRCQTKWHLPMPHTLRYCSIPHLRPQPPPPGVSMRRISPGERETENFPGNFFRRPLTTTKLLPIFPGVPLASP